MKLKTVWALIGALALVVPAAASGHVTLQPEEAAAGEYVVLDVRVPNEREDAATTKVDLRFPAGFAFASYQPVPGWTGKVTMANQRVSRIVWTASDRGGVQAGQFQDFPLSVQVPDQPGAMLTFPVVQTYDDGEVSRWTGSPSSAEPAPQVAVITGGKTDQDGGAGDGEPAEDAHSGENADAASEGLGIAALIVGALGLLAGAAALLKSRR